MATRFAMDDFCVHQPLFFSEDFQRNLARWNRQRLAPQFSDGDWASRQEYDHSMKLQERAFLELLRSDVAEQASQAPDDADGFVSWFEQLLHDGPGQGDPLFPWLADHATPEQLRWFFEQEAAGEAGFDDLVAMTQVKLPESAKLELARNYWDEMGHGRPQDMHGPMLDTLVKTLKVNPSIDNTVWESLALANAMTAMATNRDLTWESVGALGVIELNAPGRSAYVAQGLKRTGLDVNQRRYFELHAVLDIKHSREWIKNAIRPLVEEDGRRAKPMAEGALMRLYCGRRCFGRYRARLWKVS